jgi:hypothetical protein
MLLFERGFSSLPNEKGSRLRSNINMVSGRFSTPLEHKQLVIKART